MIESWKQSGLLAVAVAIAVLIGGGLQAWSLGHAAPAVAGQSDIAAARANDKPQLDFLAQFNTGARRYDGLPVEELEADAPPPITFDASAKSAGAVAVLKVDSVVFFGSNIGSLPAMRVSYHVVTAVAGVVEGQQVGD